MDNATNKKCFCTEKAVVPGSMVSQAVIANGFIYVCGQISINLETKEVEKGSIEVQTKNALESLKTILEEAGSGLQNTVMCNVYLSSMDVYEGFNEVYTSYFGTENPPARVTLAIKEMYADLDIEISAIAVTK